MKRNLLRFAVTFLTFTIGMAAAALTRVFRPPRLQRPEAVEFKSTKNDPSVSKTTVPEDDITVEGRYSNFDYAYSVLVPKGMMAAGSPAPNPNHGFGIDLMHPTSTSWMTHEGWPHAYLWVDASYDSAEYGTPTVVIKNSLDWLREKHIRVRLVSKTATHLARLRAVRFVIAYEESGEAMIEDHTVAFRNQLGEGSDIVYTIELRTPASRYDRDKEPVVEMQRSWLIDPLPNDYPLPPVYDEKKQHE